MKKCCFPTLAVWSLQSVRMTTHFLLKYFPTPYSFNDGIWNRLEETTRYWQPNMTAILFCCGISRIVFYYLQAY
jgi:hypothetical protein